MSHDMSEQAVSIVPSDPTLPRRYPVLGVGVTATDYDGACRVIFDAAHHKVPLTVTALAVHGVMTGALNAGHRHRLNALDLVLPDGQPVRWALNLLHRAGLTERVYGPELTLRVCARAAVEGVPVAFYGSRPEVLEAMRCRLGQRFPGLRIVAAMPSRFRRVGLEEQAVIAAEILASGARIVFVGLGCPRQETWLYEHRALLPVPIVAVGAAFDFHAGLLPQAPPWMQRRGLEWLFRMTTEPRRLWRRYLLLNPLYVGMLALQAAGIGRGGASSDGTEPHHEGYA